METSHIIRKSWQRPPSSPELPAAATHPPASQSLTIAFLAVMHSLHHTHTHTHTEWLQNHLTHWHIYRLAQATHPKRVKQYDGGFLLKDCSINATKHFIYILAEQTVTQERDIEKGCRVEDRHGGGGDVFSLPLQLPFPIERKEDLDN